MADEGEVVISILLTTDQILLPSILTLALYLRQTLLGGAVHPRVANSMAFLLLKQMDITMDHRHLNRTGTLAVHLPQLAVVTMLHHSRPLAHTTTVLRQQTGTATTGTNLAIMGLHKFIAMEGTMGMVDKGVVRMYYMVRQQLVTSARNSR